MNALEQFIEDCGNRSRAEIAALMLKSCGWIIIDKHIYWFLLTFGFSRREDYDQVTFYSNHGFVSTKDHFDAVQGMTPEVVEAMLDDYYYQVEEADMWWAADHAHNEMVNEPTPHVYCPECGSCQHNHDDNDCTFTFEDGKFHPQAEQNYLGIWE